MDFFIRWFFIFTPFLAFGSLVVVSPNPYVTLYTPRSVLLDPPSKEYIRFAGKNPRYSTCSGVCWAYDDQYIFAVNMQACSMGVYKFDSERKELTHVRNFENQHGVDLDRPENLACSKDGVFLAVPNMKSGKMHLYRMNQETFINPYPEMTIYDRSLHGVRFSHNNSYLASVSTGQSGISIYDIRNSPPIFLQSLGTPFYPLKAKTVDFSLDGRFMIAGYCIELSGKKHDAHGMIVVYECNKETGYINPSSVSITKEVDSVETIAFYPDGESFFSVDQVNSKIMGHSFDVVTGKIGNSWVALEGKESGLNIPHGIAFSSDGKYMAISNLKDDKITVYKTIEVDP